MRKMKVMFLFQDLAHYYNYVLNRLQSDGNVELVNVVPVHPRHKGEGVHESTEDIGYRLIRLDEYQTEKWGMFFSGLWRVLLKERPDIIVTDPGHIMEFGHHRLTRWVRRVLGIKLILKDIPFRQVRQEVFTRPLYEKLEARLQAPSPVIGRLFGRLPAMGGVRDRLIRILERCHAPIRRAIGRRYVEAEIAHKRERYLLPDAHVDYVEEAFDLFGSYGVPAERIFIIYNSPDTDRLLAANEELRQAGVEKNPHRLIHVGRLVEWKRVDLLLQALAQLKPKYPDADLLVIGYGPKQAEWTELARRLGLESSVTFLGGVYDPKVLGRHMLSSGIYVLAGMGGISINEAMCFGMPVICSVCDGTEKKLVRDGFNGFYFRNGDGEDLAAKIDAIFANPALAEKMGRNSLKIIREEMNIQTVIRGYMRAFHYVTGNRFSNSSKTC